MKPGTIMGLIFTGVGVIFLGVGLIFVKVSPGLSQQIDRLETLPQLSPVQLSDARPGVEAVLEGQVAERNPLHDQGFVAYIRREYQGERCTNDDDGHRDCESIWQESERVTPALWLDLAGGRIQLANTDYAVENPPAVWQSTEGLKSHETWQYQGFKIGNPIFIQGVVVDSAAGPAFKAVFIYGGTRQAYLSQKRGEAVSTYRAGLVFSGLGGLLILVGGSFLVLKTFR